MKNILKTISANTALLLFASIALNAQTVNTGSMVVTPGTTFSVVNNFTQNPGASFINDGNAYLYANLTNNGMLDYTNPNARAQFVGAVPQVINGAAACYFNHVVFNNSSAGLNNINLQSSMNIAGNTDFTNGIINTEDIQATLVFETTAQAINPDNGSYVDGLAYKEGNSFFEFPIGDAGYFRPLSISNPATAGSEFSAKYVFENPNVLYPTSNKEATIDIVDSQEYWLVENTIGSDNVFVTLTWDDTTTPSGITLNPVTDIRVLWWNPSQNRWEDKGGVVDFASQSVTTIVPATEYGTYTLGRVKEVVIFPPDVEIYNAVSANGDGSNDFFRIGSSDLLSNVTVEIFNRWGAKVYQTNNYDTSGNVFRGFANAGFINKTNGEQYLPSGTYFYVITSDVTRDDTVNRVEKSGYLYLTTD